MHPQIQFAQIIANTLADNLVAIAAGVCVSVVAGVFLALFSRVLSNFTEQAGLRFDAISEEITSMKQDVDRRFDEIETEVSEVQQFRTEFLSKGWTHMPPGLNDGPGLAATIVKIDTKLDTLTSKFDQQQAKFEMHDEWERKQKWSAQMPPMHVEGTVSVEPEADSAPNG